LNRQEPEPFTVTAGNQIESSTFISETANS